MNSIDLQNVLKYKFNEEKYLETALTHSSYTQEHKNSELDNNEKLEFLGDALLDAIVSEHLFRKLSTKSEGYLSKTRASIVCEKSLVRIGLNLEIGKYIKMGRGEELSGGRERDSIIADAVEAIIGAIFLDRGYEAAQAFVMSYFDKIIDDAIKGKGKKDYKTILQEKLQVKGAIEIKYTLEKEDGPDHDKRFFVALYVNGIESGKGFGKSKKEAEQQAAKEALERGGMVVF